MSSGSHLKARVDETLKQLKTKPKPNSGQLILRLESDNLNLGTLLALLKQAHSDENIKQIVTKLKALQIKIQNELDQLDKIPNQTTPATNIQSTMTMVTTTLSSIHKTETSETLSSTETSATTQKQTDCNESQDLLTKASELQQKTKNYIKSLIDSHRISESVALIEDEKRLEQIIEEMSVYFNEINKLKINLSSIESRLNKEIKLFLL